MKVTSMRKKQSRKPHSPSRASSDAPTSGAFAGPRNGKNKATRPQGQTQKSSPHVSKPHHRGHSRGQERAHERGQDRSQERHVHRGGMFYPKDAVIIWGRHAVGEALKNPARKFSKLYIAPDMKDWLDQTNTNHDLDITVMDKPAMTESLSTISRDDHIVHQGVVAMARPLVQPSLDDWLDDDINAEDRPLVVMLDQITDARNIGAIMRSARAFRASAIIATDRHCPEENGAMLRTASGAMDHLPLIRVVNLARAMEKLQDHGFMLAGMTARGDVPLQSLADHDRLGIVLGAEGKGLRRLTEDHADLLVRIPIDDQAESLNVSNAAAVALYAAQRQG